jgi:hypothetical protein
LKLESDDVVIRFTTEEESRQTDDDVLLFLSLFMDKNLSRQRVLNAILAILSMMFKKDFPNEVERMKAIDILSGALKINASSKNESGVTQ